MSTFTTRLALHVSVLTLTLTKTLCPLTGAFLSCVVSGVEYVWSRYRMDALRASKD